MGAWGDGYKENDNYYNEAGQFVQPLIDALAAEVSDEHDTEDLRARLMWTANVLKGTDEEVVLSAAGMEVFHSAIDAVAAEAITATGWRDRKAHLAVVGKELESVEEWLDTLRETGPLGNRLGPLLAAIERRTSND